MFKKLILTLSLTLTFGANVFAVPASYNPIRSVGPSATSALVSGTSPSNALSISGTTATFASGLPDNVGVGDALQYDSDNGGTIDSICFIHGRTDSTHYTVRNAAGAAPTATSAADNDWALYRAYTSLSNAESGDENDSIDDAVEDFDTWSGGKDLTSSDEQWNIACYANGTTVDTTEVQINGWTTDATRYIRIYTPTSTSEVGTSQRHDGKWNTSKYRIEATPYTIALNVLEDYVRIDGLQVGGGTGRNSIQSNGETGLFTVTHCVTKGPGIGIYTERHAHIGNNIIYNTSSLGIDIYGPDGSTYIYNNTIVGPATGIRAWYANNNFLKNNICQNNAAAGITLSFSTGWTTAANITGDNSSPDEAFRNFTVSFVNAGAYDYHLASDDTEARDAGVDLSADGVFPITDDIDGGTRSGSWDIGADETAMAIYRSVGVGATSPLASGGSNALSISGSTATFAADLPSNVGVGDAIQYDSDNGGTIDSICFIHGRTDARHYTVKKANGTTPTAISTPDNDWAVYRAYTSLYDAERGTENTSINDTVENFDTWSYGRDLVTNNEQWNITCYANGTTADTTALSINGWTTGANNYLNIYTPYLTSEVGTSQRHKGQWDDAKYKIEVTNSNNPMRVYAGYVRIKGIQFKHIQSGANTPITLAQQVNSYNSDLRVSHNIFKADFSGLTGSNIGYAIDWYNNIGNAKIWNNIFYDYVSPSAGTTRVICVCDNNSGQVYIYNNTVYNCGLGYRKGSPSGTVVVINNIAQGCSDGFSGNFNSPSDYNISDLANDAPGTNSKNLTTVSFTDAASADFHLTFGDTAAKNAGENLFEDPDLAFSDDIDGQGRAAPWSIGADGGLYQGKIRNVKLRAVKFR